MLGFRLDTDMDERAFGDEMVYLIELRKTPHAKPEYYRSAGATLEEAELEVTRARGKAWKIRGKIIPDWIEVQVRSKTMGRIPDIMMLLGRDA